MSRSVYLAGPDVFFADAAALFEGKKRLCAEFGFVGNSPLDDTIDPAPGETLSQFSRRIYAGNVDMINRSDFGVFNLTPFRGPSADAGTAFELGLMTGLGKPVFGYTNIAGDYADRIAPKQAASGGATGWRDENGWAVENFANADNLMLDSSVEANGAPIVRQGVALVERFRDLTAFRTCLAQATEYFARRDGGL
ncbi:MAG: nucleoside 2-deoxyribosyltransferase [Caulobacteraceae bacterium]